MLPHKQRVGWFVLRDGIYEALQADSEGILHSETLPGLWFNAPVFWRGDLATMIATVQQGMATAQHQTLLKC